MRVGSNTTTRHHKKDLFWGNVEKYNYLPTGTTSTDPIIGSLVGVEKQTGFSILGIGNKRKKGIYKRIATTGNRKKDYGKIPYKNFTKANRTTL